MDRTDVLPACAQQPVGTRVWPITQVYDGDTVRDICERRIRVLGIDTPEVGEPGADDATAWTRAFVAQGTVMVAVCPQQPTDHYGRVLARLTRNGRDLSRSLLAAGLATPLTIPPCGLDDAPADFAAAQTARAHRRGLWGTRATAVDVTAAQARRGFNVVDGHVAAARRERADLALSLGKARPYLKVVLKAEALAALEPTRRDRAPADWVGTRVRVAGKVLDDGGGRIIVWVPQQLDWPDLRR